MNARWFALPVLALSLACAAGCADKQAAPPPRSPAAVQPTASITTTTAGAASNRNVHVSDDIARACKLEFGDASTAPKFDFDQSALLPQDRNVLEQIAKCVTTGPLKGRSLKLVGRADPRGEGEYNMALGEHRAGSAEQYLANLGVDSSKMVETSRGKLDATGTDESGWQRDRRVDILLP